ncbi:hypothetical protein [Halobacteriovorax sp. DPLXC-1]|uniref:hypothetical protein n=1 Tax=Halobacteriovorax sp. DPLXC-1 TaxID=3110771 RepID=UPI002FF06DCB
MMKLLILILIGNTIIAGTTWVNGYTRKDGTYVRGHYRSTPDNTKTNNLGRGRYNDSSYGTYNEAVTRDDDNDGIYNQFDNDDDNDGISDDFDY